MKRFILFLLAATMHIGVFATMQESEVMVIDGEKWYILGQRLIVESPAYEDFLSVLPDDRMTNTANWNGFLCYWSIKNGTLQLDSVMVELEEMIKSYSQKEINDLLKAKGSKHTVSGEQVTLDVRVGKGKPVWEDFESFGFFYRYEEEKALSINKGIVTVGQTEHNSKSSGITFGNVQKEVNKAIDPSKYAELQTGRVVYKVKDVKVDSNGKVTDFAIDIVRHPFTDEKRKAQLAADIRQAIFAIKDQVVMYNFNGNYKWELEVWTLQIMLRN